MGDPTFRGLQPDGASSRRQGADELIWAPALCRPNEECDTGTPVQICHTLLYHEGLPAR